MSGSRHPARQTFLPYRAPSNCALVTERYGFRTVHATDAKSCTCQHSVAGAATRRDPCPFLGSWRLVSALLLTPDSLILVSMPELPEVETIRRDLLPIVVGRTITEAWVSPNAPRLVQLLPPEEFCRQIAGRRIDGIERRGKYLLFRLDGGLLWGVHLRMTGRLLHDANACPETPYLRASFWLDDGSSLCFVDLRKFGTMWLVDDETLVIARLGPEPLGEEFTPAYLHSILKRRSAPVKGVLLDQRAIAGIGNIYADEALFRAGINPRRAANTISRPRTARLHAEHSRSPRAGPR